MNKKIKSDKNGMVLFSQGLYPCKTGGIEIYNYYLINKLLESHLSSRITVLTACKESINRRDGYFSIRDNVFFIKRFGLGAISTLFYYSFSKNNNWKNVEVVYLPYTSNFSYSAIAFLILKQLFKVDYVIHIHGGGLGPWNPYWLMKLFFKNARKIAGVSYPIVEEYSKRSGRNIQYLPPLLPFEKSKDSKYELRKEKGLERFEKIILFVGSIKPLKAPGILLKAFVNLGADFIDKHRIGLLIAGDGPLKNKLESKYTKFPNIVFVGRVPNKLIKDYYNLSDIYVIPSWFEGCPISLLEAMFNKLICVGSNVTGIKDIFDDGKNGYLFEKDMDGELSEILENIILDEAGAKIKAESAFQYFKKNYNYDKHLSEVIEFMES